MTNPEPAGVQMAPPIDQRTALIIAQQVQDLLRLYAPTWDQRFDPQKREPKGVSTALIGIFARFSEIIIQRLNQAPDKNFLAFLDLLGVARLPPQPARAPLTFSLAAGSAVDAIVPAGTQVAAPPAEGEKEPVIFETERELLVTAAQLAAFYVRDPGQDLYADLGALLNMAAEPGAALFQGNRPLEHILYLGHPLLFGFPQIQNVRLSFNLKTGLSDDAQLEWQFWNGSIWQTAPVDPAGNLTQPGIHALDLGAMPAIPPSVVNAMTNRWLRCRLRTPITLEVEARTGMVRASQLPQVNQVEISVDLLRLLNPGLIPEAAFANNTPVEPGKDFFPFGEKPKLNDVLYLAHSEVFAKDRQQNLATAGATVQLAIAVANPHWQATGGVRPSDDLQLAWECWNGTLWQRVGVSSAPTWFSLLELEPLSPVTQIADKVALVQGITIRGASIVADLPGRAQTARVGEDGRFALNITLLLGVNIIPFMVRYRERSVRTWAVTFAEGAELKQTLQLEIKEPEASTDRPQTELNVVARGSNADQVKLIRITNGVTNKVVVGSPGEPLKVELAEGRNDLLIEGLTGTGANDRLMAATTWSIGRFGEKPVMNNAGFADGTYAFCQSGVVTLRLPDTVAKIAVNGQENFWLRVRLLKGDYGKDATYKLKDPTKPEEGFMLVLATFRPPLLAMIHLGYAQTLTAAPTSCLAYNNLAFVDMTAANQAGNQPFLPFWPAPDNQPTAYWGFTLPPSRTTFPNRTLSLFHRLADFKYGEVLAPLWPGQSKKKAEAGTAARHSFTLTNNSRMDTTFRLAVIGSRWPTIAPAQLALASGAMQVVEIEVIVPPAAPDGSSDHGFLWVSASVDPTADPTLSGASFTTFAGLEFPDSTHLQLVWEYWNGVAWSRLAVGDDTQNFTQPGLVEFLPPVDVSSHAEFGLNCYWLRVRWASGEYTTLPRLRRVLLNTTIATQTVTIRNETLGSSDGSETLRFRATRTPILLGQRLLVREADLPAPEEQLLIRRAEGEDAIKVTRDAAGRPLEIWVRWHERPDFYGSGPRDRHYVLDHLTGEILFGNGLNGLIPPVGTNNIRLERYQTGGGLLGNQPAGALVQLKTTVPYVDKVVNTEAATGGANAETLASLRTRAPRTLRHRNRAVTLEDYEDLARLASPAVARALCVPQRNLVVDPLDHAPATPGVVSIMIVPETKAVKPLPSLELLQRVERYLEENTLPLVDVMVVGPLYVSVNVRAEIALTSLESASATERAIYQTLADFLHPLTGGLNGAGWAFGREPYKSDFYALLEAVLGVDYVRTLDLFEVEDQPGVKKTGRFLVYSGVHQISLIFTG